MDAHTLITLGISLLSIGFAAGSFMMGAMITKNALANMETKRAEQRVEDEKRLNGILANFREWVEDNFQRKPA